MGKSTEGPSDLERDLLALRLAEAPDEFLHALLVRADRGVGCVLGLLVNGLIVVGRVARTEELVEVLDAENKTQVAQVEKDDELTDEEWEERRSAYATQAARLLEHLREHEAAVDRDLEPHRKDGELNIAALPPDLRRRWTVAETRCHITLAHAQIFGPGDSGPKGVRVLRVPVKHVAGWWLVERPKGEGPITLWDDIDDTGAVQDEAHGQQSDPPAV